ncbi:uncharacterized protein F4812DRAFT_454213 [Daldinia caldariorum]|uniref:uncharacterized protein n=1 Tax=Daldinia caldariorum TaxID=326644 RepID=UPI00200887A2|nr:uncharacterized protein F4812DRAFT_454213 [Daldinia caldariorum]KAI1472397.1 hypothetical protein F4812DRAFT_454213 [Daldinia caldariorum]
MGILIGLGAETLAAAITLCIVSSIVVILRIWARVRNGALGFDDYLMVLGSFTYLFCCIVVHLGCLSGFGATDEVVYAIDPTGELKKTGMKWLFFFEVGYMLCLPPVKVSICVALLRITSQKRYTIPLWVVIIVCVIGTATGLATIFIQCKPIAANWNGDAKHCAGVNQTGVMNTAMSVTSIITDWMCAIFPAFILWKLNMKPQVKASLIFVLALGILASISTCIRLPYVHKYIRAGEASVDGLYKGCRIVIWSTVECGVGIIAGCLPPLRPLLVRFGFGISSTTKNPTGGPLANGRSILRSNDDRQESQPAAGIIRLESMKRPGRGDSLVTTCQGGSGSRPEWGERTSESDDCSSQKLIIVKDTRIEVKYDDV